VRRWLGGKIDAVMHHAAVVVCGNEYLAARARQAGAHQVEILPTAVDLARYGSREWSRAPASCDGVPVIGWIGSPATAKYLELVRQPLADVCSGGKARIRLIGTGDPHWPKTPYEVLPWTEETEVPLLETVDIGIMPLPDTPWERGKCGYKLIQYMACGKPVVASPVGVNQQIVNHGDNGFLAESAEQWVGSLSRLMEDADLRCRMGASGRALVERTFAIQVTAPRLAALLRRAAARKACAA
jgi:glycosyltransferase involved in cell wall biosynthesis